MFLASGLKIACFFHSVDGSKPWFGFYLLLSFQVSCIQMDSEDYINKTWKCGLPQRPASLSQPKKKILQSHNRMVMINDILSAMGCDVIHDLPCCMTCVPHCRTWKYVPLLLLPLKYSCLLHPNGWDVTSLEKSRL